MAQRNNLNGRIEALQQQVEDATLRNSSVVASSRVLDPPAALPGLAKRTMVLILASGLIGGAALGCGTVLFFAIMSDKLRRRADVAAALGVPVTVSVGRITPVSKSVALAAAVGGDRPSPGRRPTAAGPGDRGRAADCIRRPGSPIAGLDNTDELGSAVAELAIDLAARDFSTTVLDLTEQGSRGLASAVWTPGSATPPTVLRPRGLPALARTAEDLLPAGQWDDGDNTVQPVPGRCHAGAG